MSNRDSYVVTLRPEPGQTDGEVARSLRAALKRLWRGYRLKCIRIVREEGKAEPAGKAD